ncbi:MAG TPA: ABC transporter ATP-binding protein [Bdellovibrionota bacterium]|nr:ABC transporter ATP-binding protein [Bdellovibrionota bacterium]
MSELLRAEKLGKVFRKGPATIDVIHNLDLTLNRGEAIAIVGASGVGKSTLLNLLGALDRPTSGEIYLEGTSLRTHSESEMARFRNRFVGFIFQFHYLLPEFDAEENVAMPLWVRGESENTGRQKAGSLLQEVGLEERRSHRPGELSGGEQQRVAIARALVNEPELILADEPTGNLDVETAQGVAEILFRVTKGRDRSLILVTHNLELAQSADRVLRMRDGRLHEVRGSG